MKVRSTLSAIALAVLGAWVLYTFPPEAHSFYPPCVFRAMTGLLCPGCGSTRALHQLLHGNVVAAFRLNPLLFAVILGGLYAAPSIVRGETPRLFVQPWFARTVLVVVVAFAIVRNVWR